MAPGYVFALCLEAAGLIGLTLAVSAMRAEGRARASELRDYLRTGRSIVADAGPAPRHPGTTRARAVDVPVILAGPGAGPARNSAARAALGRALGRGGADLDRLSAG